MNNLKWLRKQKGLTQEELASELGITKRGYQRIEAEEVQIKPHDFADPEWSLKDAIGDSIVTLIVLCLQLGYDVEECLTIAYNDIKDRQGVMIDDNFVKERVKE